MNDLSEFVESEIHEILPALNVEDYKEFHITPEETLFVYKYAELADAGKAHQIVFGGDNYTKARSAGAKLLKRKDIQDALNRMQEQIFDYALKSLPLALLQDIQNIRNLDPLDYYHADGTARMLDAIEPEKRKLIEAVEHIINNKTGEVIMRYTLPSKTGVTKIMLDLLRIKDMSKGSNGDASISDSLKTAAEIRGKVFANINIEELNK